MASSFHNLLPYREGHSPPASKRAAPLMKGETNVSYRTVFFCFGDKVDAEKSGPWAEKLCHIHGVR